MNHNLYLVIGLIDALYMVGIVPSILKINVLKTRVCYIVSIS